MGLHIHFFNRSLESVVFPFVDTNQNNFMKSRSTVTNMVGYASYLLNNLKEGLQIDTAYTEFSKAFDKIDHGLLIFKL